MPLVLCKHQCLSVLFERDKGKLRHNQSSAYVFIAIADSRLYFVPNCLSMLRVLREHIHSESITNCGNLYLYSNVTPWRDCCSDGPCLSQSDCLAFWAWYLFYKTVILHRGSAGWCCTKHLLLQERLPTLIKQVNHDSWALRCQERKNPFWDATQALLWGTRTTLLFIPRNQRLIWYLENAFSRLDLIQIFDIPPLDL